MPVQEVKVIYSINIGIGEVYSVVSNAAWK